MKLPNFVMLVNLITLDYSREGFSTYANSFAGESVCSLQELGRPILVLGTVTWISYAAVRSTCPRG